MSKESYHHITSLIIRRFEQKFSGIVQKEGGDNFITKLHRGSLDIIPWPVIQTPGFYELFEGLAETLNEQPISHQADRMTHLS